MTQEQIKTTTLKSLYQKGIVDNFSKLRFNKENNYPFITFIKQSKANNVYFSKNAATLISDNFKESDDLIENGVLLNAEVVQTENEKGETRFKISLPKSDSKYSSKAILETAFGRREEETTVQFNEELFKSQFASPVAVTEEQHT